MKNGLYIAGARACVERGKEREGGEKGKAYIGRGEGRG